MGADRQALIDLCRDVLRPLIEADEGKLYLVAAKEGELAVHLGGTCSGCPGADLTIRTLIEPTVRELDPDLRVTVTVGAKIPPDAVPIESVGAQQDAEQDAAEHDESSGAPEQQEPESSDAPSEPSSDTDGTTQTA